MSLGLSNVAGLYYQNYVNQQSKVQDKNSNVNFGTVFSARQAENTGTSNIDAYTEYLKSKYGNVAVQSVGKDQKSLDNVGSGTAGTGNVVIAPNILEEMANDPEKATYYEGKIQNYFDSVPRYEAELSAMGHEIHSSGIIIHPDGTVTHYISGDLKPEERAKIEAKIKEEKEEKAKRRQEYAERSEEAAERRRQLMENYQHKQLVAENLKDQIFFINKAVGMDVLPQVYAAAVTAYDKNILGISESGIL